MMMEVDMAACTVLSLGLFARACQRSASDKFTALLCVLGLNDGKNEATPRYRTFSSSSFLSRDASDFIPPVLRRMGGSVLCWQRPPEN
jgi:hypothetical protein